jgi:hypothetical protein
MVSKASAVLLLSQDHAEEAFMRLSPVALLFAVASLPTAYAQKAHPHVPTTQTYAAAAPHDSFSSRSRSVQT